MKKLITMLVILFSCFLCSIEAKASDYGIENFNMNVTVLPSGDLHVREAFSMNGTFNGIDREINFQNPSAPSFTGDIESLKGSSIYNGSDIELIQIRAIPNTDSMSWNDISNKGTVFKKVTNASAGTFGVYTENRDNNGVQYRIFNPSHKNSFFYLEYIIKNMAISHNDVSEIGWNLFSANFRESIHYLNVDIFIPNNKNILRAWAHGPLIGNIALDGTEHIKITVDGIPAYTAIDTRFVFDQSWLIAPKKKTNIEALDMIIQLETELADQANEKREEIRKQLEEEQRKKKMKTIFLVTIDFFWLGGLMIILYQVYKKHDKEYESTFKTQYFRDFPAEYNPSTVGYLFRQHISNDDLSACLLNLISKKIVTFEKIEKKNYKLIYHEKEADMTDADRKLVKLIFQDSEITLSMLKKKAKSGYKTFINDFTKWKEAAKLEAINEKFFENKGHVKLKASLYSVFGMVFSIFTFDCAFIVALITFLAGIASMIYFLSFIKRTKKGNEHYLKWKALKKFMEDFGRMDKKELPEIVLWEKYLVYAVSLGCADKLAKTMELRIKDFTTDMDMVNINYNIHMVRDMMVFNHVMSTSINSAINNAYSAQSIANSSNSSGGGFGGGFSGGFGGGGSFGGGSGGGRF